jgi:hypothetical protein
LDRVGRRPVVRDAAGAEEECHDTGCSLHPADSRRQEGFGSMMFEKPPVGMGSLENGVLDQGVGQPQCELEHKLCRPLIWVRQSAVA